MPVTSSEELQKIMRYGMAVRTTGATQMNEQSSRSHAILTIHINKQSSKSVRNIEVCLLIFVKIKKTLACPQIR